MKKSSSKSFGYLFFGLFLILSLWPVLNDNSINFLFLSISAVFLILTIFKAKILDFLNNYWIKLGELLGRVVAPIIMFLVFFVIVTPLSLLTKLLKKDLLNMRFNDSKTYWANKVKKIDSMDKQF
ncbi:MAG: SxtJ family membrane protein [Proteobacteria bacterium]|nr:SxtJ family membrane protein [Pseudomonadota bacterium]